MSYLAKLKQIESNENFENVSGIELPKPPKPTFGSFGSTNTEDIEKNLLLIQSWLFWIGEPEKDHYVVLNKCRNDPEAMQYFLNLQRRN